MTRLVVIRLHGWSRVLDYIDVEWKPLEYKGVKGQ